MKLWTIQPIEWFEKLQKDGVIYGDKSLANIDKSMLFAYNWITNQMEQKISPKPSENSTPIWTWYQYRNELKKKPDLRCSHLPKGTKGIRIEINKNENDVLLSDYDLWHCPLNYWRIQDTEKDDQDFDELLKSEGVNFINREKYTPILRNKVEESWHKVFDMNYSQEYSASKKEDKSIQATFWKLSLDEVVKVDYFTAR